MRRVVAILVGALVLTLGLPLAFGQAVSTQAIRNQWSPPCAPGAVVVKFPSGAKISVDPRAGEAFGALAVTTEAFGYNVRPGDTGAYNCRRITGGSGYSLHAYKIAADLNWTTNFYGRRLVTDMPPAMTSAIKGIRTNSGQTIFRWGGDYSGNKDAMHFEIIVSPAVLASGVNWASVARGGAVVPAPVIRPGVPVRSVVPAVVGGQRRPAVRPRTRPKAAVRFHTHRHCHRDRRRPHCHRARHRINSGHHR